MPKNLLRSQDAKNNEKSACHFDSPMQFLRTKRYYIPQVLQVIRLYSVPRRGFHELRGTLDAFNWAVPQSRNIVRQMQLQVPT